MIDKAKATRQEFIDYLENLEGFVVFLESENHRLNLRLQEYEGIETDESKETEFQRFWVMFGKKGNLKTTKRKFSKLSKKKKTLIFEKLPAYIAATPDKTFRKNAETWINQECWNDFISPPEKVYSKPEPVRAAFFAGNPQDEKKLEELRKHNAGVSIKERLKLNKGE